MNRRRIVATTLLAGAVLLTTLGSAFYGLSAGAQSDSRYFPETGHTVRGRFLTYWLQRGQLAQQGYPISEEMQERSQTDGKTYTVQYFERAVFEWHPENQPPYDVLLSLLGVFEYQSKYPGGPGGTPSQVHNHEPGSVIFSETGKRLGGIFLEYWRTHGGLPQQGFPISNEFKERSPLNGKEYTVQYFERAVFEWHPENKGTQYEVLLSQLGTFRHYEKHAELTIPTSSNRMQTSPQGSDNYLVWVEQDTPPIKGPRPTGTSDILGINLKTGRQFPVANALGDQTSPAIAGSVAVWLDHGPDCPNTCLYDIMGKDLSTGESFAVVTGQTYRSAPAVAGKNVAWGERDIATGRDTLVLRDVYYRWSQIITSTLTSESSGHGLYVPQLSEEYLVWLDLTLSPPDPNTHVSFYTYTVQAHDLRLQRTRSIFTETLQHPGGPPTLSLSGHRLVWNTPQIRFADLKTGEVTVLPTGSSWSSDPLIRGDLVLWLTNNGLLQMMKLSDRTPVTLVRDISPGSRPTIAGDWIVWANTVQRLSMARFSALVANPPTPLPTPVPTQPGFLPTPTRVNTPGPDLTASAVPSPRP